MQVMMKGKRFWMNFHHLYYFYVIANEGSLAKASKFLHVGQPSLSSQVKQLEQNLQVDLFDRTNKRLELTKEGKQVHEIAARIFDLGDELVRSLSSSKTASQNILRMGITESTPKKLVADLCRNILKTPGKSVNVVVETKDKLIQGLKDRNFDALITNFATDVDDIESKRISSSPVIICGSSKFKNLSNTFPKSINKSPFMMPLSNTSLRKDLDTFLRSQGVKVDVIGETQDISMQKMIATEGLGLIAAPFSAVEELIEDRKIFEIGRPPQLNENLYLLLEEKALDASTINSIMSSIPLDH